MPKIKLKLSKEEAAKVAAAHSLAGTSTDEAFMVGTTYHITVRGRSAEMLYDFGFAMGTLDAAGIAAYEKRVADVKAKAEKAKAEKKDAK